MKATKPLKYRRGRRYKTVGGLVRYTMPKKFADFFAKAERERRALIARFAKDPNHKHVREEIGTISQLTVGTRILKKPRLVRSFYWCKICHADLD